MADRKASLIRCAKIPGQGWRRGILIKTKNGRIKPDYIIHKGEQVYCPQGKYEIRYYEGSKAIQKTVGNDLDGALAAFALFEKKLQYEALQEDLERLTSPRLLEKSLANSPVKRKLMKSFA